MLAGRVLSASLFYSRFLFSGAIFFASYVAAKIRRLLKLRGSQRPLGCRLLAANLSGAGREPTAFC